MELMETYEENVKALQEAWLEAGCPNNSTPPECCGMKTKAFLITLIKVHTWCWYNQHSFRKMIDDALKGRLTAKTAQHWIVLDKKGIDPFIRKPRSKPIDRHDRIESAIKSFYRNSDGSFSVTFRLPSALEQEFTFTIDEEIELDPTAGIVDLPAKGPMDCHFLVMEDYAGIGGGGEALKTLGGKVITAIEVNLDKNGDPTEKQNAFDNLVANADPQIVESGLYFNRKVQEVSAKEIVRLSGLRIGQLGVIIAGFPCQSFSGANPNRSVDDPRSVLMFDALRHVRDLQPAIVILENVLGWLTYDMAPLVDMAIATFKAAGYRTSTFALYASDYGCPQTRPRTIIVGYRNDFGIKPTMPPIHEETVTVKDVLPNVIAFRSGDGDKLREYTSDRPASTITKSGNFQVLRDGEADWDDPSIEELRVLGTFPEDYEFVGTRDDVHERIGNAIMPRFMENIASHFLDEVRSTMEVKDEYLIAA